MSIIKYGRKFATDSLLSVELLAFREGWTPDEGGLGRHKHFENIVREIWPEFIWYDWSYQQAEALCNERVSGFMAGASATKSDLLAKYGLVKWWSDPLNTLVIICSTTAVDAKQRVWGHVVRDYRKARSQSKSAGKLVESRSIILLDDKQDGVAASDNSSISLVAAGDEYKDDALKRLQGRKNKNVVLLIDEGQDVSQTVIETALWNLSANENFEVHMVGNGSSRFDPLGEFMKPIEGWNSVNRATHKWRIRVGGKEGVGIHFDLTADHSPNMQRFAQGLPQLPFMRKAEDILTARNYLGENNITYMRQFVGFPPDKEGETNFIVTEQALTSHEAFDSAVWKTKPVDLAGIDPSYSNGGDRFVFSHCKWGLSVQDIWTLEYFEDILIKVVPVQGETKDHANIRACKQIAQEREISPRNVAMDSSAGSPLLSIAHKDWSPDILGVEFGGAASDLSISAFDKRPASDVYDNATSEMAYVMVEFLNCGQIRGVRPDRAKELTARTFKVVSRGRIRIESKPELKARLGYSPDLADAGNIALRLVRQRLHVLAGTHSPQIRSEGQGWKDLQRRRDVVTLSDRSRSHPQRTEADKVMDDAAMHARTMDRLRQMLTGRPF